MKSLRLLAWAGALLWCIVFGAMSVSAQSLDQDQAEAGHATAQYALGMRYRDGDGVLQSFTQAADWLTKAAKQGYAPAQNMLAQHLFEGLGIPQDQQAALNWFEKAARTGQAQFQYDFGSALQAATGALQDLPRAAQMYQLAAEQGHQDAQVSLGVMYQNGIGLQKDLPRARNLYEGPAANGHAKAQNNLGLMYVRGEGVQQDYERAAALFQQAAEQGLRIAMTNLGVMYENGFGVPMDEALAHEFYRRGGQGDDARPGPDVPVYDPRLLPPDTSPEGIKQIGRGVQAGDPVAEFQMAWLLLNQAEPDYSELTRAARLMRQAAEQGMSAAMANLGWMYFEGRGLPQDYVLGHMWLVLASSAGNRVASELNARYSTGMMASQINEAQRLAQARLQNR